MTERRGIPIGQYPFGLLSLINAKSTGETPPWLSDVADASVDVSPYYLAAIPLLSGTAQTLAAAGAVGTSTTLRVPAREAWQLVGAYAGMTNGTPAASLSFSLNIVPPDSSFPAITVGWQPPIAIVNAGQEFNLPWTAPEGFVIGPGTGIQVRCNLTMATTIDQLVRAIYRPLPV